MYSYNLLWKMLIDRGINRSDLIEIAGLSPTTIAAMGKGAGISPKVLERLCQTLDVQPGDIMEYVKN